MKSSRWFLPISLLLSAAALWTLQSVGLAVVQVRGPSMVPSYSDGQVLFVNRLAYGIQLPIIGRYGWIWKAPTVGDPVVVESPEQGRWVVKRVAGTEGMPLTIEDHQLRLAGRTIGLSPSQEYWLAACSQVPAASLFVVGDNEAVSKDSRDWGFVPLQGVVGRALF